VYVESLATQVVGPILREARFKKKGLTWNRKREDLVDVVNIQRDKGGLPESFTVNVGVFIPDFYEIVWGVRKTSSVGEAACPVRIRIGPLMQGDLSQRVGTDVWWDLDSDAALEKVGLEISHLLSAKVLPFLDSFQTIRDVHAFMDNARGGLSGAWDFRLYLAIAKYRVGDAEGAKAILEECRRVGWTQHAERVMATLGL
jgi:hypothetical protein